MPFDEFAARLNRHRQNVNLQQAKLQLLQQEKERLHPEIVELLDRADLLRKGCILLQACSKAGHDLIKQQVEPAVTAALREIFNLSIKFEIEFKERVGGFDCNFYITDQGRRGSIFGSQAGGFVDIATLIINLIFVLRFFDPPLLRLMLLDEPLTSLDSKYESKLEKAASFLQRFSQTEQFQMIVVTHEDSYEDFCDRLFYLRRVDGLTKVSDHL